MKHSKLKIQTVILPPGAADVMKCYFTLTDQWAVLMLQDVTCTAVVNLYGRNKAVALKDIWHEIRVNMSDSKSLCEISEPCFDKA